jgi:hypothetical protein
MRVRKLVVAWVVAALAAGVSAATAFGVVGPTLILDAFNGTSVDSNVWAWYGTNQPGAVTLLQSDGAFKIQVASTAANDVNVGLGTRCGAHGDFDARLSFNLPVWPAENGLWVSLNTDTNGYNTYRVSWRFPTVEEAYGAYLPDADPSGNVIATTQTQGVLRLARTGSTWSAYFQNDLGDWVLIASGPGPTRDIHFIANVFNLSGVLPFGGQATTVEFTKFKLNADSIVC